MQLHTPQEMNSPLAEQILNLRPGDHLCLIYEKDPAEQIPALIPFIQEGLSNNEQFIYIADDHAVEELMLQLEKNGIDVAYELKNGRLKLWTRKEWRQPGELDSAKKLLQVKQFIDEAFKAGFKGIRFAVEMTWTLGPDISAEKLEHWEATINTIFVPQFPGRIICQYNRSRLSPENILAALHTHPLAIIDKDVCRNPFYQAPLLLNGGINTSNRAEWMLSQLKQGRLDDLQRRGLAQERLAAIVESSDDAIISKDLNGIITSWNKGAERIFGYSPEEVIGKSVIILIPSDHQDEEVMILSRIRRGERIEHYETIRQRKDGKLINISLTVFPVKTMDGRIIGISKIGRDITKQKEAEKALAEKVLALQKLAEELAKSNRELEQFAFVASHDLQEPLNMINSFVDILSHRCEQKLQGKEKEYLDFIKQGATQAKTLIRELLEFSRVGRDRKFENVDLKRVVSEVESILRISIKESKARIQLSDLPHIRANYLEMVQLFQNLISNAIKYRTDQPPHIRISCSREGEVWLCSVQDNGIGIAPEYQERIFGMFQRLHSKSEYSGTGIGLAVCKKIVEHHGGRIWVESESGKGATFSFTLNAEGLYENFAG